MRDVYVFGSGRHGTSVGKRIGFGLYQSCGMRGSVGRVSVFGCGGVGGECYFQ